MGLFGKQERSSRKDERQDGTAQFGRVQVMEVIGPPDVEIAELRELPLSTSEDIDESIWALVHDAYPGNIQAEASLRKLANFDDVNGWVARVELGTLLVHRVGQDVEEGLWLLLTCLEAPYADIVGKASWNISEVLWLNGREQWFDFAAIAAGLEEPIAMVVLAERADETGDDIADEWINYARLVVPRISSLRRRVEALAARRFLEYSTPQLREWYTRLSEMSPRDFWASNVDVYTNDGLLFNVEAGYAAVASKYFEECPEECYYSPFPHDCRACGRNQSNFLSCMAGQGDGAYYTLQLLKDDEFIGAISLFKDAFDDLGTASYEGEDGPVNGGFLGPGAVLDNLFSGCAPIILGQIHTDENLLFSDASKCIDGSDLTVVRESEPGAHLVVAWASIPLAGDSNIRPLALTAFRGSLADQLRRWIPRQSPETRDELIGEMWGGGDLLVASHFVDVRPELISNNIECQPNPYLGLSWALQFAESDDGGTYEIVRNSGLPESTLRELLRVRGVFNPKFPWMNDVKADTNKRASISSLTPERLSELTGMDFEEACDALNGELAAQNSAGYLLLEKGHYELGLPLLVECSLGGFPWAYSNASWHYLMSGQFDLALDLFAECQEACEHFVALNESNDEFGFEVSLQWINAQSNNALCGLAVGDSYESALLVWEAGRLLNHTESLFYPALAAWKMGRKSVALSILEDLDAADIDEIQSIMENGANNANGWFAEWCNEGLSVIAMWESTDQDVTNVDSVEDEGLLANRATKYCEQCGGALKSPAAKYCGNCGHRLDS